MKARGKVQIACHCCGVFSGQRLCQQCTFAGCGTKKKNQQCHVQSGRLAVLPNLAGAVTGVVMRAAGKAIRAVDRAAARELGKVSEMIDEVSL